MPLYEYECPGGHMTQRLRRYADRDNAPACGTCASPTDRVWSHTHSPPSGVYSYEPNIGDADVFERRHEAIKSGQRVVPKILPRNYIPPNER